MSGSESVEDVATLLLQFEKQLMEPTFRKDREKVSSLLAEEFFEFGSSGRVWSRVATLDLLANETYQPPLVVEHFSARPIAPETVLVTYKAIREGRVSLRSSIWINRNDRWQIVFHQGTKVPAG